MINNNNKGKACEEIDKSEEEEEMEDMVEVKVNSLREQVHQLLLIF